MEPAASTVNTKYKFATIMATLGRKERPNPKPRTLLPKAAATQYTSLEKKGTSLLVAMVTPKQDVE